MLTDVLTLTERSVKAKKAASDNGFSKHYGLWIEVLNESRSELKDTWVEVRDHFGLDNKGAQQIANAITILAETEITSSVVIGKRVLTSFTPEDYKAICALVKK